MKSLHPFPYRYTIVDISEGDEVGYQAIIPKFPNIHVMADTPQELPDMVVEAIEDMIAHYKKKGRAIPNPDNVKIEYSGNLMIRISPELHKRVSEYAECSELSMNKFVADALEKVVK